MLRELTVDQLDRLSPEALALLGLWRDAPAPKFSRAEVEAKTARAVLISTGRVWIPT